MGKLLRRLCLEQQGQDVVECALLLTLVAMAAIASFKTFANALKDVFTNTAANLATS
jgi:Flp pilus assembly pilin Flp